MTPAEHDAVVELAADDAPESSGRCWSMRCGE
jgi:hypothetical protein